MKNIKEKLTKLIPANRWLSIKKKALSTLWQCFIASSVVFYANGVSLTQDTIKAFLSAFVASVLSAIKNILVEYNKNKGDDK
jgi:hypothetical protein